MPQQRVLFVKLSSLGDVVHHMPAVTDLARARPGVHIAWAVEEAYAGLVKLHPAVEEAFPVSLRALAKRPLSPAGWARMGATRRSLREGRWDFVVDTQGLLKSAIVARFARAASFGLDKRSARERSASRFYDVKLAVPRAMHAVERNRRLVAQVFGYAADGPADYGLSPPAPPPAWAPPAPYTVLLHAASRAQKRWPEEHWVALGREACEAGLEVVLPGGTVDERTAAERIAKQLPRAMAAPAMNLDEAAALLAHARCVAGVDTGLTHLAAALGVPTVGIYGATRPELTGLHAANAVNVGGAGRVASVEEVLTAFNA
ncbi:MAG TPA: lipopolysaccharide heptosyltransferase I [Usitatibacter sp.]|nr:lipopolysaccharide heptosyltransferase I [Usitatibacter sp.]